MKKKLISLILAGTLFLFSPLDFTNKKNNLNSSDNLEKIILKKENPVIKGIEKEKTEINKEKDFPKSKETNYIELVIADINKKEEEYLYEHTKSIKIFNNEKNLEDSIISTLKKRDHTYRKDNPVNEHYNQINNLSLKQKKAIYLMLDALKDSSFVNNIRNIIQEDLIDNYSEKGGIVEFKENNKINLRSIESAGNEEKKAAKDTSNNEGYSVSLEAYCSKKIGYFHLHSSKYNESKFAGPSSTDEYVIEESLKISNLINEFIITSLKKGEFNMDYIGVDISKSKKAITIDLGNYIYDSLNLE
ncbi:MAG TPA: hypothetical protein PK357_00255 [Candidatus Pacearchaeota archaeon]|nr:hypothetical protein [Candidatus Pacearchaeota archaeon]